MESEFIALDKAGEEAEWLRQFLEDIPLWPKPMPAICIHCDNQASISREKNLYITVSVDIFVVEIIPLSSCSQMEFSIDFIYSKDNLADPFTKGLSEECINCASRGMV